MGEYHSGPSWNGNSVLFLFVNTIVHRLYQCGTSIGCHFFISDFFTYGRLRFACSADEYFWMEGCYRVCGCGSRDRGHWRYFHRENALGRSGRGIYPKWESDRCASGRTYKERPLEICVGAGRFNGKKGGSVCADRCWYRCSHS